MVDDDNLPPSELGTLEYWESTYDEELNNFTDHGEEGENWFGEGITKKIIQWINQNIGHEEAILDIGCGNGTILIRLCNLKYEHLTGIDYSTKAIGLAKAVSESNGASAVTFQAHDLLAQEPLTIGGGKPSFKVIIDKGTYDAICLNPEAKLDEVRNRYIGFINGHLQAGGFFLLTSCNWTFDELLNHFTSEQSKVGTKLVFIEQIKTPTMTFGGKSGNRITSVIFQLK